MNNKSFTLRKLHLKAVMVLVHVFEYIGNPFKEVSGHVKELLTLDVKKKINDVVEQKTGNVVKTGQQ